MPHPFCYGNLCYLYLVCSVLCNQELMWIRYRGSHTLFSDPQGLGSIVNVTLPLCHDLLTRRAIGETVVGPEAVAGLRTRFVLTYTDVVAAASNLIPTPSQALGNQQDGNTCQN